MRALHFIRDERGATAVEFALITPVMSLIMMGILDLGHTAYVASQTQGAVHQAARQATVGNRTGAQIDTYVINKLRPLVQQGTCPGASCPVTIQKKSYSDYTGVKKAEKIITDTAPFGTYNAKTPTQPGDCHEDVNGNNVWDQDRGRDGLGGADDVVRYEVTVRYNRLLPVAGLFGWSQQQEVKVNTLLKNQPYAAQTKSAQTVCA